LSTSTEYGVTRELRLKKGGYVLTHEQKENRRLPLEKDLKEAIMLIEQGFRYVCEIKGLNYFESQIGEISGKRAHSSWAWVYD